MGPPGAWMMLVAAPFIGSFLGVLAIRLPQGKAVAWGRSRCESCGQVLSARDLIPILSFALLRGRCRHCGKPIGALALAIEIAAIAVAGSAALVTSGWVLAAGCLLGWSLLLLAAIDWRTLLLPDVVTLPLLAAGLAVAYLLDLGPWRDHAIGAVAGFAAFALLAFAYRRLRGREGLGLGDAKLMAALGAWLTWEGLPTVVLWGAVLGLLYVLGAAAGGRRLKLFDRIAFGTFLAVGGWLVWLFGPLAAMQ